MELTEVDDAKAALRLTGKPDLGSASSAADSDEERAGLLDDSEGAKEVGPSNGETNMHAVLRVSTTGERIQDTSYGLFGICYDLQAHEWPV